MEDVFDSVDLPIIDIPPKDPPGGDTDPQGKPFGGFKTITTKPAIDKSGAQRSGSHQIEWMIKANQDILFNIATGKDPDMKRSNIYIEDELEPGQVFYSYDGAWQNYILVSPSAVDGERVILNNTFLTWQGCKYDLKEVKHTDSFESYDQFKARVLAVPCSFGIYENNKFIVNLGDMPGDLKLPLSWGKFKEELNAWKTKAEKAINDANDGDTKKEAYLKTVQNIYDTTYEFYAEWYDVPKGIAADNTEYDDKHGLAMEVMIRFLVTEYGESREVSNEAHMYFNTEDSESDGYSLNFSALAGGGKKGLPGSVTIEKYDAEITDKALNGTKFKLQKKNEDSKYEDYAPPTGDTVREVTNGSIVYERVNVGDYKVVEVEAVEGYSDKPLMFDEGDGTFSVTGEETSTVKIVTYNDKEAPDNPPGAHNGHHHKVKTNEKITKHVLGHHHIDETKQYAGTSPKTDDTGYIIALILLLACVYMLVMIFMQYRYMKD